MKKNTWHSIGWIGIILAFLGWEYIGLRREDDQARPFTYWVRQVVKVEPLWFLSAGFLAWLPYHFLYKREK